MRITYENSANEYSIYIYLREFNGEIVNTLVSISVNWLLDKDKNWIGLEVFNKSIFCYNDVNEITYLDLPILKNKYIPSSNELVSYSKDNIRIMFGSCDCIDSKITDVCNIDYNSSGGLQGLELFIDTTKIKMKFVDKFRY